MHPRFSNLVISNTPEGPYTALAALDDLRKARISVIDLLLAILGGEFSEFYSHRKLKDVSPEYVEQWDVGTIMDPVANFTPTWSKILYAASEPQKGESEDTRNQPTV
jgi:hypothetical protein